MRKQTLSYRGLSIVLDGVKWEVPGLRQDGVEGTPEEAHARAVAAIDEHWGGPIDRAALVRDMPTFSSEEYERKKREG